MAAASTAASESMKLVQLKCHLAGIVLREITMSEFKYVFEHGVNTSTLRRSVQNHMPLMKSLNKDAGITIAALTEMCTHRPRGASLGSQGSQGSQSITTDFIAWMSRGYSYTKNSRVVIALQGNQIGADSGASSSSNHGSLTYVPVIKGIAVYGEFTGRKDTNSEGEGDDPNNYKGMWNVVDKNHNAINSKKDIGEIEFVCSNGGAGTLLVEYCIARMMNTKRNKQPRIKAIICNLSSALEGTRRVYPLQRIVERLGFTRITMNVIDKNTQEIMFSHTHVDTNWNTRWFAMDQHNWRSQFLQKLRTQLEKFTSGICASQPRSGISYCT